MPRSLCNGCPAYAGQLVLSSHNGCWTTGVVGLVDRTRTAFKKTSSSVSDFAASASTEGDKIQLTDELLRRILVTEKLGSVETVQ